MHVLVVLALVAALATLIAGLLTTQPAWVLASIVLSTFALFVAIRSRPRRAAGSEQPAAREAVASSSTVSAGAPERRSLASAEPSATTAGDHPTSGSQPAETSPGSSAPAEVWVVDGRPRYHRADCAFIEDKESVAIPLGQAVEDGFTACSICRPPRD